MNIRTFDISNPLRHRRDIRAYLHFCRRVYAQNPHHRDLITPVLKELLTGRAVICSSSWLKPLMVVKDNNQIVAVCLLAVVDRLPHLMQITYFEALPQQAAAVNLLIQAAREAAVMKKATAVSVGLNLHVNYGLGLLSSHFDTPQTFGSAYNSPEYPTYFAPHAGHEIKLVSYLTHMPGFDFSAGRRLMERMPPSFHVRPARFHQLKEEIALYTHLNNAAFGEHPFYYPRRQTEDLELFQSFRHFLRPENLLFLYNGNTPVGFMLWYPDFNQLIPPGEGPGLKAVIKNRLFSCRIDRFKIVELGIIPAYQKTGAVLALFDSCHRLTKDRYQWCEAGWILSDNRASTGFGRRWAHEAYKEYRVFLLPVQEKTPPGERMTLEDDLFFSVFPPHP
ncbi:hypothetical protein [Anoxynatronum sibiricum]|uniref:N-acetyltransferase domain-containing protein n=1 Tax=Anoxynatronum sibiricum TaxID=210623 RepID=A0ABU9VWJ7_9CLOT